MSTCVGHCCRFLSCVHRTQLLARGGNGVWRQSERPPLPTELRHHWAKGLLPCGRSRLGEAGSGQELRKTILSMENFRISSRPLSFGQAGLLNEVCSTQTLQVGVIVGPHLAEGQCNGFPDLAHPGCMQGRWQCRG